MALIISFSLSIIPFSTVRKIKKATNRLTTRFAAIFDVWKMLYVNPIPKGI